MITMMTGSIGDQSYGPEPSVNRRWLDRDGSPASAPVDLHVAVGQRGHRELVGTLRSPASTESIGERSIAR